MATPQRTVTTLIGEDIRNIGKPITMIALDWDVDADASREAMEAIINTVLSRGTILAAGAVYDTGTKQDYILEGNLTDTINSFTSLDGTVTGTLAQVLVEDIINLGTVDSINFGSGTVACSIKSTLKFA
jgi:hypothetical protein|tara:strand:- start:2021 stop:2407 length:387 start_codon:yes stop_codon:yes gene_type:complete